MQLRKEQVVLAGTLVVLGWLVRGMGTSPEPRGGGGRESAPDFLSHPAPAVDRALPGADGARGQGELARELFSPPRDTRPLPPLELEPPPTPPLAALRPPPVPGPAPSVFGRFLRVVPQVHAAPDLFEEVEAEDVAFEDVEEASGGSSALAAEEKLDAAEFAERVEGWTKVYDWIRVGSLKLGRIVDQDRFGLAGDTRPIHFVEFDPVTGRERFNGQAIAYERARVEEFGFADTVANRIELERLRFGDPLTAGEYEAALAFARSCIEARLQSPRALLVAEEMFRRAAAIAKDDPSARIGLARVHEAAFDFEAAFQAYRELLDGDYARDARVLVPLALLERRLGMLERAEARLFEAERYARTAWQVQAALGRHLLEAGRHEEAVQHLRLANQYEPAGAEHKRDRAELRTSLGCALLAVGELEEADSWMKKALSADAEAELAAAGQVAVAVTAGRADAGGGAAPESAGFEWLVANGLARIAARDFDGAKQDLSLAARVDPLRAAAAWRALSWLAEITGHPEEAWRYVEQALENDPTDVWSLIQHGRVLAARDDLEGALESYRAALGIELELADALAAMGELAHRRGEFADAERYFERALALDPGMTPAHDLRGINLLELGATQAAEAAFRAALAQDADEPTALCGLAWCLYRAGDTEEAIVAFRELDDARRDQPEDDPWRAYARAQIERLTDHLEKVSWTDRFERRSLRNNWGVEETAGPTVSIVDGAVRIAGVFKTGGRTRLWQVKPAGDFVAFQARITVRSSSSARAGILVTRERARRGESLIEAEVSISRHPLEGLPQLHFVGRGEGEAPYENATGFAWPTDAPVTLRIERVGDANDGTLRILLDGFPIAEETLPTLGRTTTELRLGAFVEGESGREADVLIDDVELVYRER